jgi:hypothetical protein
MPQKKQVGITSFIDAFPLSFSRLFHPVLTFSAIFTEFITSLVPGPFILMGSMDEAQDRA